MTKYKDAVNHLILSQGDLTNWTNISHATLFHLIVVSSLILCQWMACHELLLLCTTFGFFSSTYLGVILLGTKFAALNLAIIASFHKVIASLVTFCTITGTFCEPDIHWEYTNSNNPGKIYTSILFRGFYYYM